MIVSLMKVLDGEPIKDAEALYVPTNALDVMTDIAIASPAVCAYRQSNDKEDAKMVAKAIASVFNKSESAAVIDRVYSKKVMMTTIMNPCSTTVRLAISKLCLTNTPTCCRPENWEMQLWRLL